MYLEYSTNNAILRTFVNLLVRGQSAHHKGVGLATPTGVCSIQNHDRETGRMVLRGNGDTPTLSEGSETPCEQVGVVPSAGGEDAKELSSAADGKHPSK